ncbi:MAG: hypothetical protein SNJ63_04770 [Sphingomonadaceae bacterium]
MAKSLWLAGALALGLVAAPATAQGARMGRPAADAFAGMSAEGRRIMTAALLETRSDPLRPAAREAQERVLRVLEGDPLDRRALAEAMKAEDDLIMAELNERRERMLAAYAQLSAADRKAYVKLSREQRAQMQPRGRAGVARP